MNLLIGIAEDQNHLEKYFDKRTKRTYFRTSVNQNGKMKLTKKGGLVYRYGSDHSN